MFSFLITKKYKWVNDFTWHLRPSVRISNFVCAPVPKLLRFWFDRHLTIKFHRQKVLRVDIQLSWNHVLIDVSIELDLIRSHSATNAENINRNTGVFIGTFNVPACKLIEENVLKSMFQGLYLINCAYNFDETLLVDGWSQCHNS